MPATSSGPPQERTAQPPLPPPIARLWGLEPRSTRGPAPRLDLAAITAAAIEIADAEGLGSVSMRIVAERVGLTTMALYRYVDSKDELLSAMVEAVPVEPPSIDGRGWREYLAAWTRANRDLLLERPWLLAVPRAGPPLGPRSMRWLDRALAALGGTPLDHGERLNVVMTLTLFAFGSARLAHEMVGGGAPVGPAHYGATLARVADADAYPALRELLDAGVFTPSEEWVEDSDFASGLDILLDGIEALIRSRG